MNLLRNRLLAQANCAWQGTIISFFGVYGPHGFAEVFDNSLINEGEVFATLDDTSGDFDDNTMAMVTMLQARNVPVSGFLNGGSFFKVQRLPPGTYNGFNSGGKRVLRINGYGYSLDGESLVPKQVPFSLSVYRTPLPPTQTY